jgi:hypothetical protein
LIEKLHKIKPKNKDKAKQKQMKSNIRKFRNVSITVYLHVHGPVKAAYASCAEWIQYTAHSWPITGDINE